MSREEFNRVWHGMQATAELFTDECIAALMRDRASYETHDTMFDFCAYCAGSV